MKRRWLGQIEVRAKALHGHAALVPLERELDGFVGPREAVEVEELREGALAGVGEWSCGTQGTRLGCRRRVASLGDGTSRRTGLPSPTLRVPLDESWSRVRRPRSPVERC